MSTRRRRLLRGLASCLICLPFLYVASIGPACWLTIRTNVGTSAIDNFYRPITWAMWNNEGFESWVMRYTSLWAGFPCHWEADANTKTLHWKTYIFMNNPVGPDPRYISRDASN